MPMAYKRKIGFERTTPPAPKRPAKKSRLRKRRIFMAAALTLVVITIAVAIQILIPARKPAAVPEPLPPPEAKKKSLPLKVTEETIQKGQTISKILSGYGFSPAEIDRLKNQVKEQVKPALNLNKIIAGQTMKFAVDAGGVVQSIEYALDDENFLFITREGSAFKAERKKYPFEYRVAYISGTIEDNPSNAVLARGENESLAIQMTDLFSWDIDFYTELREGDSFRMVYEKKFLDGKFSGYGNILAAEFICQGKKFQAFRFVYPDTKKADHFDREGKSVRKEFLRSPFLYTPRITSRFSSSRLHPIRKVYRAHFGVDYGAPIGTRVQATADGVVTFASSKAASGRMVRIRHKNSYETLYLHLSKITVKEGDRVTGGQKIGEVGSSGESTGPHLDYRVKQGGSYVNPLSWKFQPVAPLRPEFKDAFKKEVETYELLLDAPLMIRRAFSR